MMNVAVRSNDRFVTVDGLNIRYLEEGKGVPAILLHGASLGSSADVFRRNLKALGANGIRAIAFDLPGFGKSDATDDFSAELREEIILEIHGRAQARASRADRAFGVRQRRGRHRVGEPRSRTRI